MNKVILMGRITRDPELRTTPNGISVLSFPLRWIEDSPARTERGRQILSTVLPGVKLLNLSPNTFQREE